MDSEFDKIDVCVKCKIREFCNEQPDDMSCEDVMRLAGILPKEDDSLFDLVRTNYNKANAEYLQKQLQIASKYLTLEQRKELERKGIFIVS